MWGSAVRRPRPAGTPSFPFRKSREARRETVRIWPGDASGGYGLSDPAALHIFVSEGLRVLTEHAACGVPYLRDAAGGYRTYATLGMSYPRVGEVKHDGAGLTLSLRKELLHRGALLVEDVAITGLVLNRDGVQGAWGTSNGGDTGYVFIAPVVILACGAATELYPLRSASFHTGDAIVLPWKQAKDSGTWNSWNLRSFPVSVGYRWLQAGLNPLWLPGRLC